jgi:LysR family tcuABC transcriptional regulator
MELRQLRYFVAVVETGAVSRAAEVLHIVQPAVSHQLARLETEIGEQLLTRSSTGAVPNDAGRAFYEHAKFILRQCDSARSVLNATSDQVSGPVSIGLAPTTAAVLGLALLLEFRRRYPQITLTIVEALSGHLASMVLTHSVDLAILFTDQLPRQVDCDLLVSERLFLMQQASSPGPSPAPARKVTLRHACSHPLILPSRAHGLRTQLDLAFAKLSEPPRIVAEIDSLALIMEAVRQGVAATIEPWAAIRRLAGPRDDVSVEEISDKHVERQSYLCLASKPHAVPAAFAARDLVRDVTRRLVERSEWVGTRLA